MRAVLINLERATERRARMESEFAAVGLPYEIKEAIDGRLLSEDQLSQVDWDSRRRLGLDPPPDGAIALWLTSRDVMADLVENGPEMMAVFEDDAHLESGLSDVLNALEQQRVHFDIVRLGRRHPKRRFIPCVPLTEGHTLGRVRYADSGSEGYVITRAAARYFLKITPKMIRDIDHALLRYWTHDLNVFYVDPPVAHHGGYEGTFIGKTRTVSSRLRGEADYTVSLWQRAVTGIPRAVRKYVAFRKLLREDQRNVSLPLINP